MNADDTADAAADGRAGAGAAEGAAEGAQVAGSQQGAAAVSGTGGRARAQKLSGVKGMHDLLPSDSIRWMRLESIVADWAQSYGYRGIRTPIVEPTALFRRGLGDVTDIVEKEMYSFQDALNGEQLSLRPEMTAGVVRAVVEHNLLREGPRRLWYQGPMFRHERPQRGRYRQFHQIGVEALGFEGPDVDIELIAMCQRLWGDLDLDDALQLQINSIGDPAERAAHRTALIEYLQSHEALLDDEARRRLHSNPLRILDSKNAQMQSMLAGAPQLLNFLGSDSRAHFDAVCAGLADLGIAATINPRLVRGMDYYNRTVFEWVTDRLGAQATVCGGGRYDGLIGMLGGKPAPACGFAIGVERLLDLASGNEDLAEPEVTDVYVVHDASLQGSVGLRAAEQLRAHGLDVVMNAGGGSFKSQFRRADASGATVAVVFGPDEAARGEFGLKTLRGDAAHGAAAGNGVAGGNDVAGGNGAGRAAQSSHPLDDLVEVVVDAVLGNSAGDIEFDDDAMQALMDVADGDTDADGPGGGGRVH